MSFFPYSYFLDFSYFGISACKGRGRGGRREGGGGAGGGGGGGEKIYKHNSFLSLDFGKFKIVKVEHFFICCLKGEFAKNERG